MALTRRHRPLLGLALLLAGSFVSVARAAEELDNAGISGWGQGGIGGFTGAILTLALLMVQQEVKSRREAKAAPPVEPSGSNRPAVTPHEVEELIKRLTRDANIERRVSELEQDVRELKHGVSDPLAEIREALNKLAREAR